MFTLDFTCLLLVLDGWPGSKVRSGLVLAHADGQMKLNWLTVTGTKL